MTQTKEPDSFREEMLARLIAQYELTLLRMCYMYLHDRGLAEDAVQETFLKAYRAFHTFRGESSEKTWLMRIALNTCRDMKRGAWFRYVDRRVEAESIPVTGEIVEYGDREMLAQAILRLPVKYREVILLYYYQDMTLQEIAHTLNIAVSTAGKRIKAACLRLERLIGKEEKNDG